MPAQPLLTDFPAFAQLQTKAQSLQKGSISALIDDDTQRTLNYVRTAAGLRVDFSKYLLDDATLALLLQLAQQADIQRSIAALFGGDCVNTTENRPALHTLLRADADDGMAEQFTQVSATRASMQTLADTIHHGKHQGFTGKAITDVVNIGIGGSDLGPRLATQALAPYHGSVRCHYVANVDPADISMTLAGLEAQTTLFIICSKSFRTEETLANGLTARQWLLDHGASHGDLQQHFLAVTTNLEAAAEFGIASANCLPMWDWVGGRYSVWSAVGLSTAIAIGWDRFSEFLQGARHMDLHFRTAAHEQNVPLILSLLELWSCNLLGATNHVVLPYDQSLNELPDYLQQLTMESNGKSVNLDGITLPYHTAPVLWGSAGTIGQHSFHQLLHQGTLQCPADFILPLTSHTDNAEQHRRLVANCLAQSRTLMVGRTLEQATATLTARGADMQSAQTLAPHLVMSGNRSNTVVTMEKLTPSTLGALLAMYEHKTYCSAQLWGINPFDQWGVEVGKDIGVAVYARLQGDDESPIDPSTDALIAQWREANR